MIVRKQIVRPIAGTAPARSITSMINRPEGHDGRGLRANSLIRPEFPCSAAKMPLFPAEQGIGRNTLMERRDHAPAPEKTRRNAHDFEKVPVKFPDGREIAGATGRYGNQLVSNAAYQLVNAAA
jgi:hypothetical protein